MKANCSYPLVFSLSLSRFFIFQQVHTRAIVITARRINETPSRAPRIKVGPLFASDEAGTPDSIDGVGVVPLFDEKGTTSEQEGLTVDVTVVSVHWLGTIATAMASVAGVIA